MAFRLAIARVSSQGKSLAFRNTKTIRDNAQRARINGSKFDLPVTISNQIKHQPKSLEQRSNPYNSSRLTSNGLLNFQFGTQREFSTNLPKHIEVGLPALSPTMEQGNLAKWKKKEGDKIKAGDVIAEVETDKATIDFETTDDGYLAKILVPEGAKDLAIGAPIAILVSKPEDVAAFANYKAAGGSAPAAAPQPAAAPAPAQEAPKQAAPAPAQQAAPTPAPAQQPQQQQQQQQQQAPVQASGARTFASPLARSTAAAEGVDVNHIQGSGPGGRIIQADVLEQKGQTAQAHQSQQVTFPAGASFVDIPNSNIRKITAERLSAAKNNAPHFYLFSKINVDKLVQLRTEFNAAGKDQYKLSINDFIIKACAVALRRVPEVNSSWQGTFIRRFNNIDINVAVATDKGLITPLIKDADRLGLVNISQSVSALAEKARQNKLTPQEFASGSFTISNLGMFGIDYFTAIINPPQACILAVGGTEKVVVPDEKAAKDSSNPYKVIQQMTVGLSCDHRVVDGAVGAQFLKALREILEDPRKMLL